MLHVQQDDGAQVLYELHAVAPPRLVPCPLGDPALASVNVDEQPTRRLGLRFQVVGVDPSVEPRDRKARLLEHLASSALRKLVTSRPLSTS